MFASNTMYFIFTAGLIPVRYQLCVLSFIGLTSLGAMRQSVGVAMVVMVNTSYVGYERTEGHIASSDDVLSCKDIRNNDTDYIDVRISSFIFCS